MESAISYEFTRNNVYGDLNRALTGLYHNAMGLLAEKRAVMVPAFTNDAHFYYQAAMASYMVAALQKFCEGRLQGDDYYEARRALMDKFNMPGKRKFSDEQYEMFNPPAMENLDHESDEKQREIYRTGFVGEFEQTLNVLYRHIIINTPMPWANDIIFSQINEHLPRFKDSAEPAKNFGRAPVTREAQFFFDAARWLKQRSTAAQVKASLLIPLDMQGLGGIFEKSVSNTPSDRLRLGQYAAACEALGANVARLVESGGYIPFLREYGFTKKDKLLAASNLYCADVQVNLPLTLENFAAGFHSVHTLQINCIEADEAMKFVLQQGIDDMMSDLREEFLMPVNKDVPSVHKAGPVPAFT